MKLAFKKVGEGGNDEEEGDKEIDDLADEDSEEDDEGDLEEEKKEEEVSAKPGFLRRATNTVKASSRRTVSGIIGTKMTNSEVWATFPILLDNLLLPHFLYPHLE